MPIWAYLQEKWGNGGSSPEFMRAQYDALLRQLPLMYGILLVNMTTPAVMYHGKAPFWLTVVLPVAFGILFLVRASILISARRNRPTQREIARRFRSMTIFTFLLGLGVTAWSLALFPYGNAADKGQVTFFAGVTIVAVITCMMPLRHIAAIIFAVVVIPMAIFLLLQPEPVYRGVAINMVVIIAGMMFVLRRSHAEFRQRVEKQNELDAQRRKLQTLNHTVGRLANEDSLTGLPNRRRFFDHLDGLIGEGSEPLAVGLIDLDGFKPVNDVLGHRAGDSLLAAVGERLARAVPEGALVARLGGDEFGLILPGLDGHRTIRKTCREILSSLEPSFHLPEGTVSINATCGVACYPVAGRTGSELFERADFALYYSKEHDRGAVTIFSDSHERAIKHNAAIAQRLREADLDDVLYLEYQPIVACDDGAVLGMEALARWNDPELGRVPPDIFIRTAEQNGMIGKVTTTLFAKALQDAAHWPQHLYLSFNLSARDLCSPETMVAIIGMIGQSAIEPGRLVFEITESTVMQDFDRAVASLDALHAAGCSVALDDFGTGYSSLSYVRRLPIDRVKVDASFVRDIESEPVALNLLKTIAEMSRNLGMQCIVEGVETPSQLKLLGKTGCSAYQGYYFARPMPAKALSEWLRQHAA